jgi:hypothetical protein
MEFKALLAWRDAQYALGRIAFTGFFVTQREGRNKGGWFGRRNSTGLLQFAFDGDLFDDDRWRPGIEGDDLRVDHGQAVHGRKPKPAIARLATSGLAAAAAFHAR